MYIPIILAFISIIILFLILNTKSNTQEFKNNIINDIILPKMNYEYSQTQNELIIPKEDNYNSFPLDKYGPKIVDPVVPIRVGKPDEAYVDNVFERDIGVTNAMKLLKDRDNTEYTKVINAFNIYQNPIESSSQLKFKTYNEFTQDELTDRNLHDIYDEMVAKVDFKLSNEEIERISGKPINIPEISNLYKPVYVSIDNELNNESLPNNIYKYNAYEKIPFGSLI